MLYQLKHDFDASFLFSFFEAFNMLTEVAVTITASLNAGCEDKRIDLHRGVETQSVFQEVFLLIVRPEAHVVLLRP